MKHLIVLLLISALIASQGCSAFQPHTQTVTIQPTNPAAEIIVDGQSRGTGTVSLKLQRDRSHAVLAKVGDRVGAASIGVRISGTGVLDLIGTVLFLLPVIGMCTPGFWELDSTHVNVVVPVP
jgi:hypothetical protein